MNRADDTKAFLRWLTRVIANDPIACRRGVDRIVMHPARWTAVGEPLRCRLRDGSTVPVMPTGRKFGSLRHTWYARWYYKVRHKRAFTPGLVLAPHTRRGPR